MKSELVDRFGALRAARHVDVRAGAEALQVPEARLFAAHLSPDRVRLRPDGHALLNGLQQLGPVRFHTDTRLGVHRVDAHVEHTRIDGNTAWIRGDAAELRFLLGRWASAWAVMHNPDGFAEPGIHIHDPHGDPIVRVVQTPRTRIRALQALVTRLRAPQQHAPLPLTVVSPQLPPPPVDPSLRTAVLEAWPHMRGTRDFGGLLRRHALRRPDAYALVAPRYALPISVQAVRRLIERCVQAEVPVALSMGNRACIQTHRGPLDAVAHPAGWLTILDPTAFVHLQPQRAESIWVVRRPGPSGVHLHVELLGRRGDLLGSIRSSRAEHQPEHARWQQLVASIVRADLPKL